MTHRIVFTEQDWARVRAELLKDSKEASLYALMGVSSTPAGTRILVRELLPLVEADYNRRSEVSIQVTPSFINRVAARCEKDGLGLLIMHSHPFEEGDVWFSPTDDRGEERVLRVFHDIGGGQWPLASLVLAPNSVKARIWNFAGTRLRIEPVHEIVRLGDHVKVDGTVDAPEADGRTSGLHARQVLAFGREGQARLARATIAIIGAGGTGSACAEMLARLGVGRLILIDGDTVEESNVSRVYGSTLKDVGRPKVTVLGEWLSRVSHAKITAVPTHLQDAMSAILGADLLVICTDTESSRSFANQLAYQHMMPLIEIGNRIDSKEGVITSASTRMTIAGPGFPCLECYGSIDHDRVRAELMSPQEYKKLRKERYVADLDAPNPSVISLNTFVASQAVTRILDLLVGIGGPPWKKWVYTYLDGELRPVMADRRARCICRHYEAFGDLKPLPAAK